MSATIARGTKTVLACLRVKRVRVDVGEGGFEGDSL